MNKIKTSILIVALGVTCAFSAKAQTVIVTNVVTNTVYVTASTVPTNGFWYDPLWNLYKNISTATNIAIAPFAMTLTSGDKQGTWGGGVIGLYNVTDYLGTGIGLYNLGGWYEFNGTVQLQYPLSLASWMVVTPFLAAGIGTSFAGAGSANGNVDVISQIGVNADLFKLGNWQFGGGGFFGNITGAGQYSGNDAGGFIKISRGF